MAGFSSWGSDHLGCAVTVFVRGAREGDLPDVIELLAQLHDVPVRAEPPVATGVWRRMLAAPDRHMLVAEDGCQAIGTADLLIVDNLTHGGMPWAIAENVIVDAEHRRRGVGRALMERVIDIARRSGCYKIQLLSNKGRIDARHFYAILDFEESAMGLRLYLTS